MQDARHDSAGQSKGCFISIADRCRWDRQAAVDNRPADGLLASGHGSTASETMEPDDDRMEEQELGQEEEGWETEGEDDDEEVKSRSHSFARSVSRNVERPARYKIMHWDRRKKTKVEAEGG